MSRSIASGGTERAPLRWEILGADCAVAFIAWLGMDGLAFLRLSVRAFAGTYALWAGGLTLVWWAKAKWPGRRWIIEGAGLVLSGAAMMLVGAHLKHPLPLGRAAYGASLIAGLRLAWRAWRIPAGVGAVGETARRLLVVALSAAAVYPFFCDNMMGGVDARWYAYMLNDFIAQLHAGVFPVFVGQGELAFNGGVHPFRSAPVFMWLGGAWDFATLRALPPLALQHLTAITAAVVAGAGMYAGLSALAPRRRWLAVIVALLYLGSPGVLATLYLADMYMTWMAIAVLPFVVWGNARVALSRDEQGWTLLSASLALLWMCHPPIAMEASLTTALIQGGRWLARGVSISQLLNAVRGGLWFGAWGLYYFYGMSELPPRPPPLLGRDLILIAVGALGVTAVVRCFLFRSHRILWGIAAVLAAGALWKIAPAWFWWLAVFATITATAGFLLRRRGEAVVERWRAWLIVGAAFVAATAGWYIMGPDNPAHDAGALAGLARYAEWPRFFQPVSPLIDQSWDFQPGAGVNVLFLAAVAVALVLDSVPLLFFAAAVLALVLLMIRVPGLSDFLVGYFPHGIGNIINLPLALRLMPVIAAFGSGAGFLALASISSRWRAIGAGTMLVVALIWTGQEGGKFVRRGWRVTQSRALTAVMMKPENSVTDKFVYDLLRIPDYFSHGKTDPRLEIRILNTDLSVRIGPDDIARKMEAQSARILDLHVQPSDGSSIWLKITPDFPLAPHEHALLRFEFRPDKIYDGYLMLVTDWGDYREYILPESGYPLAFGTKPEQSKVLSLWNSTDRPLLYHFTGQKGPRYNLQDNDTFARVVVSHYDPNAAPIRIESFIPLRITAELDRAGYVETPRVFLPGYEATVDGRAAPILQSPQKLVMVPLAAGAHWIELRFVGSRWLRLTAVFSGAAWIAFIALALFRRRAADTAEAQSNF